MRGILSRRLSTWFALFIVALALTLLHDSASSSSLIQGDANCSGEIASTDALAILRQTAAISEAPCAQAADTDCDSDVDAVDALNVLRFVAALPSSTPDFCPAIGDSFGAVTIVIDTSLQPSTPTVDSMDGGPPQPVEVAIDPDGVRIEFVGNEVIYKPEDEADLQAFLQAHGGSIVRDGTTTLPDALAGPNSTEIQHGYYLIRIDTSTYDPSGLAEHLEHAGISGEVAFSSEDAVRVMALAAGDDEGRVQVSGLGALDATNEHPLTASTYLDAETFDYFTSGSGLNIGVTDAWKYLRYQGVVTAANAIPFQAVRVAVIDTGFALSETSGIPLNGNVDFFPPSAKPTQYDADGDDYTAGGEALMQCSGGSVCTWHGTEAFGTCCAIPNNYYGSAGSAGPYVVPILIKVNSRVWVWAEAIRQAELFEADVLTMSFSYTCGTWCGWFDGDIGDALDDVGANGRIPLAAAGNDGVDIGGDDHVRPCEFVKVVCVGGITDGKYNLYNYGSPVDIWGPVGIITTVTPESAAIDADSIGMDELPSFNGTSAATPFVAGIVALMKSLNPSLTYVGALNILKNTSNSSPDPKVTHGYVNALQAALAAKPNLSPVINGIRQPEPNQTYGYAGANFRVDVTDPEPGTYLPEFASSTVATFTANGQVLCSSTSLVYRDGLPGFDCTVQDAPLGTHNISVTVTDPFGAQSTAEIDNVKFVNTAPTVQIIEPADGATYYATQSIEFTANVYDPEECCPFPQDQVGWYSDLQGGLGFGSVIETSLVQGTHTVTITATDEKGISTQESITLHILSGAGIPTVQIMSPPDNSTFGPGVQITFTGQASDPEDGPLTGDSLDWYSDIDGYLGSGEQLTTTLSGALTCQNPYQPHVITLRATDSDGHQVTDQIDVAISLFC